MLGLSDRYYEIKGGGAGHLFFTMEGYENDIMSPRSRKNITINTNHYKTFIDFIKNDPGVKMYRQMTKFYGTNGDVIPNGRTVDIDSRGFLIFQVNANQPNPYEYYRTKDGTRKDGYN